MESHVAEGCGDAGEEPDYTKEIRLVPYKADYRKAWISDENSY